MRLRHKLGVAAATLVTAATGIGAGTTIPSSPHNVRVQDVYVRNVSSLPDAEVKAAIPAFQRAADQDFRPYWQVTAHLHFVTSDSQIPAHAIVFYLQNQLNVQGALAYHDVEGGTPTGRIGVGVTLEYGASWTVGFTHELWEMLADPSIVRAAQSPDGRMWAFENADPVEDERYAYTRRGANGAPVLISDFVTDAWFGASTAEPYDFTHNVTQPLQVLPGGYAQFWDGTEWQVIYGQRTPSQKAWVVSERGERG